MAGVRIRRNNRTGINAIFRGNRIYAWANLYSLQYSLQLIAHYLKDFSFSIV